MEGILMNMLEVLLVELAGVAHVKGLCITEDVSHHLGVLLQQGWIADCLHVILGTVHGENHGRRYHPIAQDDVLAVLIEIGSHREHQTLHEGTNFTRRITVIDW